MNDLEYYLRNYLRHRALFLSLIRAKEAYLFQDYLPFKGPILDVGCGDGFFANVAFAKKLRTKSSELKAKEIRLIDVGLDVKESRVEEARSLNIYKKIVVYDGQKMPFPDNTFRSVISNCVLEHIPNLPLTISEVYRVLKPGGLFITTVMAKPWEDYLFGNLFFGETYKSWMRKKQVHLNLNSAKEWDKAFMKTGFHIKKRVGYLSKSSCRLIDICHYFSLLSLLTYKLFGKWILFPNLSDYIYPVNVLQKLIAKNVATEASGGIFYVLRK